MLSFHLLNLGMLEVMSTPPELYPDMDRLELTLGDPKDRVQWRTKQA